MAHFIHYEAAMASMVLSAYGEAVAEKYHGFRSYYPANVTTPVPQRLSH